MIDLWAADPNYLISERYKHAATILTSNLAFEG
jgi:hypothetical protein